MQSAANFEKKRQQQFAMKERAIAKQRAKLNDPVYREKQLEKQRAANERYAAKQRAKHDSEEYKAKLLAQQERQREKQRAKTKAKPIKRAPIKATSPKGRTRTAQEVELHDQLAALGCICCINMGLVQPYSGQHVSVHHCDGRTKKDAHKKSLPLCETHHDTPLSKEELATLTLNLSQAQLDMLIPIHAKGRVGGKKAWELAHGTQEELMAQIRQQFGIEVGTPPPALVTE